MPPLDIITPKPRLAARPKKTTVSFKVPADVGAELEALRARVKQHAKDVDFNYDAVLTDMLKKVIQRANRQLDSLGGEGAASS